MNINSYRPFIGLFKMASIFFLLCSFLFGSPLFAAERDYIVPMIKAKWTSSGKKNYECSLSQMIPYYGEGKFTRKSGHKVVFNLYSDAPIMDDAQVIVQSEPPSWRHDKVFEIAKFNFQQGHNPLFVKSPYASRMLQEVENGMSPVVIYRDLADGRDIIAVMLSPINFRKALAEYIGCEKTLLDFDMEAIKNLKLYFATNKAVLTDRSKRDLKNIPRFLKIDKTILQIKIDAHADARGRRRFNDRLSERRSKAVVKYLLSVGAKPEMLYVVNHGERKPKFSNKTALGRSKNRRADVQLLTTPPPTPEEQKALEEARKAARRKRLLEGANFGKRVEEIKKKREAQEQKDNGGTITPTPTVESEKTTSKNQSEEAPEDDEPPAPNFINLEHMVDKNNKKIEAK